MAISAKQQKVLDYIRLFTQQHGYPPSVRDICQGLEMKSTSTAHGYLERLEKQGYIRRDPAKTRAIELVGLEGSSSELDGDTMQRMVSVPLMGNVAAGEPLLAEELCEEVYYMPKSLVPCEEGEVFALQIKGDSMVNAGILDGDKIIVKRAETADNGEIVVALVDNEATCKRFFKEKDRVRLQPENDFMAPMFFKNVMVLGKVVGLVRQYLNIEQKIIKKRPGFRAFFWLLAPNRRHISIRSVRAHR